MTFKTTLLAGTVIGAMALAAGPAAAQATQAQIDALNKQIQALQAQVKTLSDTVQKDIKKVDEKVAKLPNVSVDGGRLRVRSADKAFDTAIRARLHLDYGQYLNTEDVGDVSDGFNVRRAFLGVAGKVYSDWGYEFTLNFADTRGGSVGIQAANLTYTGVDNWTFVAGVTQPKFTLDDSTSSNDIAFMERAPIINTLVGIGGSDSRLAVGAAYSQGNIFAAAYLTGNQTGSSGAIDDQANLLGRLAAKVWEDNQGYFAIGASGVYQYEPQQTNLTGTPTNAAIAGSRTARYGDRPGIRIGGDPARLTRTTTITDIDSQYAYGSDVAFGYRSLWAAAEYYTFGASTGRLSNADDPQYNGWYASAGYILTGERRGYKDGGFTGVKPSWPVGQKGFGAWEVAVRYSVIDLADTSAFGTVSQGSQAGEETSWTFGVNWYVNPAIRVMLNYVTAENDRLGTATDTELDAVAARLQFQF